MTRSTFAAAFLSGVVAGLVLGVAFYPEIATLLRAVP